MQIIAQRDVTINVNINARHIVRDDRSGDRIKMRAKFIRDQVCPGDGNDFVTAVTFTLTRVPVGLIPM